MSVLPKSYSTPQPTSMPWRPGTEAGAASISMLAPYGDACAEEATLHRVPPINDIGRPIDELAFVLATDHLSTLEKIVLLEQWRYDALLVENGATEGLGDDEASGGLLQHISKALIQLESRRLHH